MRSRLWRSASSLAGPAGTLLVMLVLAGVLLIFPPPASQANLTNAIAFLAFLQATALVLNLIPAPGFDGYGILRPYLPAGVRAAVRRYENLAPLLLLAAIFFIPAVSDAFFMAAFLLTDLLGLPRLSILQGLQAFQFWKA
jgi:Zn-dependent protease